MQKNATVKQPFEFKRNRIHKLEIYEKKSNC